MKKDMFLPYREFLRRIILSVETPEQLKICYDMIDRFIEVFKLSVGISELNEAQGELYDAYQLKNDTITII
jgi:hypothetical protein